ncbi:hypothetical protein MMC22_002507 [Lobaria immixta]|nr:hypothetical protein [Lobaria immixta]
MHFLWIFFFAIVRAASILDSVPSGSTDEKTADVAADDICSFEGTTPHGKRQLPCHPVNGITNPMQNLDDGFRNLLQSNEPKKPIEIPKDSIQVVPKKDDPIIVTPGGICLYGYEAVCCRMWWREAFSTLLQWTVFDCWEYLATILVCEANERVWCCPVGQIQKRGYLRKQGSDCYNPYGLYGPPPPEQIPGQTPRPLGDPLDPSDPGFNPLYNPNWWD